MIVPRRTGVPPVYDMRSHCLLLEDSRRYVHAKRCMGELKMETGATPVLRAGPLSRPKCQLHGRHFASFAAFARRCFCPAGWFAQPLALLVGLLATLPAFSVEISSGFCSAIAAQEGRVWIGYPNRVELWDVPSGEAKPRNLAGVPLSAPARQLLTVGSGVLAVCGEGGAVWIEIASSNTPPRAHWLPVPPPALAAAERNGLLALAGGNNGVWLFSVTNPAAPVLLGGFSGATDAQAVGFVASLVCVGDGTNGLKFLDVSTPARPELVGVFAPAGGPPVDALAISTTLLVTAHGRQLRLMDASDPRHPVVTARHELPASARSLAVGRLRLWVACGAAGTVELDLVHALTELSRHATRGSAEAVAAEGSRVFVAEGEAGWRELTAAR